MGEARRRRAVARARLEDLASEDPDDRACRLAHGFTYDDDWRNPAVVCRNGCGLPYEEVVAGKVRRCLAGSGWRVFVGDWCEDEPHTADWVYVNTVFVDWEEARDVLVERLSFFESDDCGPCRRDAAEGMKALLAARDGDRVQANVEGTDYVLVAAGVGRSAPAADAGGVRG